MAIELKTVGEYRRAINALMPYTRGFEKYADYDFTDQYFNPLNFGEKMHVRRYFDVLMRHAGYKGTVYQKFKSTEKLHSAQRAMGMPTWPGWRGVFVPQPDSSTPARLVRIKGQWVIEYTRQGVDTVFVPFDRTVFAELGTEYLRELLGDLPVDYLYNLDMGYGRNRWGAGGNLEQVIRDLGHIINGYGNYSEFVMGVHVYRGGLKSFNKLKTSNAKTMRTKKLTQEKIRKIIRKERRELTDYQEWLRLKRKFT